MGLIAALLGLLALPVAEIAVFILVGEQIGLWPTIGLVLLSGVIGVSLLREEGFAMVQQARQAMARDVSPIGPIFDGLCKMAAGILFILPGFVTDFIAILLLLPPVRRALKTFLARNLQGVLWTATAGGAPGGRDATVVEGEFRVVSEDNLIEVEAVEVEAMEVEEPEGGEPGPGGAGRPSPGNRSGGAG